MQLVPGNAAETRPATPLPDASHPQPQCRWSEEMHDAELHAARICAWLSERNAAGGRSDERGARCVSAA